MAEIDALRCSLSCAECGRGILVNTQRMTKIEAWLAEQGEFELADDLFRRSASPPNCHSSGTAGSYSPLYTSASAIFGSFRATGPGFVIEDLWFASARRVLFHARQN